MAETAVRAALREVPLGGLRVYGQLGSTNDEALAWAAGGAEDLSLVVADEQTAGRGRARRRWYTPAGSALAFSLILRPSAAEAARAPRLSGLAALAVADALAGLGLVAAIKWPNDVLVRGRKLAGILAESLWTGMTLSATVLGIGINVLSGSAPTSPEVAFPVTTVETELNAAPNRWELMRETLSAIIRWRSRIASDEFISAWERRLIYRGEDVIVTTEGHGDFEGTLVGLDADRSLLLRTNHDTVRVEIGDLHLRPASDRIG